jgi:hypothetical protein
MTSESYDTDFPPLQPYHPPNFYIDISSTQYDTDFPLLPHGKHSPSLLPISIKMLTGDLLMLDIPSTMLNTMLYDIVIDHLLPSCGPLDVSDLMLYRMNGNLIMYDPFVLCPAYNDVFMALIEPFPFSIQIIKLGDKQDHGNQWYLHGKVWIAHGENTVFEKEFLYLPRTDRCWPMSEVRDEAEQRIQIREASFGTKHQDLISEWVDRISYLSVHTYLRRKRLFNTYDDVWYNQFVKVNQNDTRYRTNQCIIS